MTLNREDFGSESEWKAYQEVYRFLEQTYLKSGQPLIKAATPSQAEKHKYRVADLLAQQRQAQYNNRACDDHSMVIRCKHCE